MNYCRGDIYIAEMNANDICSLVGKRPVIILSDNSFNRVRPYVYAVPISAKTMKYDTGSHWKTIIKIPFLNEVRETVINCDMVIRISKNQLENKVGQVNKSVLSTINETITKLFGFKCMSHNETKAEDQSVIVYNAKEFMNVLYNINEMAQAYKRDNRISSKIKDHIVAGIIGAIIGLIPTIIMLII